MQLDAEILRSAFTVRTVRVRFHPRPHLMADTWAALRLTRWADVVLAWFGGVHALLPFVTARLLGKRCAVIASGVDVAAMPSIQYGHMRPGWLRSAGRLVFRLAHRVFAVSGFTAQEAAHNTGVAPHKIEIIPHGLPPCPPHTEQHAAPSHRTGVITVATVDARAVGLKGLTTFVRTAARCPDVPFEIVGGGDPATLQARCLAIPPNVTFTGWLPSEALQARMQRRTVYVQLSAYESFGMALAEAMQCGCRPVVTRRGALPEVVGDAGWYVPYGDPDATARAIREALDAPAAASRAARRRIMERFPLSRRRRALVDAVRALGP
ncbi:MAG: glycosyltransferase [Bacteroidetes bacterium]|nr:glycosyltransferase [Bacteroidota bacterium]